MPKGFSLFDIVISGAGHTGQVTALAFAKHGFSVALIDPVDRSQFSNVKKTTLINTQRTTAYLNKAIEFLDELGVWQNMEQDASALETLAIVNQNSSFLRPRAPTETAFHAHEIGKSEFGFNVPLEDCFTALSTAVKDNDLITAYFGVSVTNLNAHDDHAVVTLSDGQTITTKLLIGADGGQSAVRQMVNIRSFEKITGQTVMAFNVIHDAPHGNRSSEIYSKGGPFTLIPMKDKDNHHRSAVVWMQDTATADHVMTLSSDAFLAKVNDQSCGLVGHIQSCSDIATKPVTIQVARQMVKQRVALLGEAAHHLPPIGAQGFNLSIQDISTLLALAQSNRDQLGGQQMLTRYQQKRLPENIARSSGVGLLNLLAYSGNPIMQMGREMGLALLRRSPDLRRLAMTQGMFGHKSFY